MGLVKMQDEALSHPKLLLIDDHPLFCDALSMTVSEIFDDPTIYQAASLQQALEQLAEHPHSHLIVLDLNLPDVEGIEGLVQIKKTAPYARLIVVSSMSDNRIITSVLAAGADGFVPKDAPRDELITAFQTVENGGVYTPADFHKTGLAPVSQDLSDVLSKLETLTPQQSQILRLMCEGKLNKQIAYDLSIAETTVKAHLTAILRKLGVQNRTQAVLLSQKASFGALSASGGE